MRYIFALPFLAMIAFSNSSLAAEATPNQILPVTLSAEDLTNLQNYLNEQPYKFSAPVLNLLTQKETEARAAVEKK